LLIASLLACGGGNGVTLQTNGNSGGDTTAPTLTSSTPANTAVSVAVNTNITLLFSEKMDTASVSVTSDPNSDLGSAAWNAAATELSFNPPANLEVSSDYTLSVIGKDVAGNALAATSIKFTTAGDSNPPPPVDTTAPNIASSSPEDGRTNAAINSNILVTFSEAMNPSSITVSLNPSVNLGAPSFKSENSAIEFNPPADLSGDTSYTVNVIGKDVAGNALTGSSSFTFKTTTLKDTIAPATPKNLNAFPGDSEIRFAWDTNTEPDLKGYTLYYGTNASNLSSSVFVSKPNFTKTLTGLTNGQTYFYQLEAEDGAGNRSDQTITKNATPKDSTPPKLLSSTPNNGAVNVLPSTEVILNFSEPMSMAENITYFKVACRVLGDGECNTNTSYSQTNGDKGLKLTGLSGGLGSNAEYSIELLAMRDKAGNSLPQTIITFTVRDVTAPSLISSLPLNNTEGLPTTTGIVIHFSEPMSTTDTESIFRAHYRNGPTINGGLSWSNDDKTLSFQPNTPIFNGGLVDWVLGGNAKDRAGNVITIGTGQTFRAIRQTVLTLPAFASGHLVLACSSDFSGTCGITKYFNETVMRVGDRVKAGGSRPYEASRGLLTFLIRPTRPANASLVKARLQVKRSGISGDPANTLGGLFIESAGYGNPLAASTPGDYRSAFWDHNPYPKLKIFGADINEDVSSITSTSEVQFLNYRLYFATDYADNNIGDFYDYAKNATLTVTYEYP
jgi:methionine-rich copper-binding protein CopC